MLLRPLDIACSAGEAGSDNLMDNDKEAPIMGEVGQMMMKQHSRFFHAALRLLVATGASVLAMIACAPLYRLLVRLGVDGYAIKWVFGSPLIVGAFWILGCLMMRNDPRQRKPLLIDLGLWVAGSAVCMSLLIYGMTHYFGFL